VVYWRSSADFLVLVLQACPSADMKRSLIALCRTLSFFQNWVSLNWKLSCLSSSPHWLHLESSDKTVLSTRSQMQLQSQSDHLAAGTYELQSRESTPLLKHILQSFDWDLPIWLPFVHALEDQPVSFTAWFPREIAAKLKRLPCVTAAFVPLRWTSWRWVYCNT
jgi:hypothetical protein